MDEREPVTRLRLIITQTAVCKAADDTRVLDTLLSDMRRVTPGLRRAIERLEPTPAR